MYQKADQPNGIKANIIDKSNLAQTIQIGTQANYIIKVDIFFTKQFFVGTFALPVSKLLTRF